MNAQLLKLKCLALLCCFGLTSASSNAQNLVPNPSFENFTQCPDFVGQSIYATNWQNPNSGSPDFFHTCNPCNNMFSADICIPTNIFGSQLPHSGDGYVGMYCYWQGYQDLREYLQVALTQTLVAGTEYEVSYYVSLGEANVYGINELGAACTPNAISNSGSLVGIFNVTPQMVFNTPVTDTLGWTLVTGTFIASGGEAFLTIGNFFNDQSTTLTQAANSGYQHSYYYVDDVSLVIADLEITGDSVACAGDSVALSTNQGGLIYWEEMSNPGVVIDSGQNIVVMPGLTTTYLAYSPNDSAYHTVQVTGSAPIVNLGNDTTLCIGQTMLLDATNANATYQWQDNSSNATFNVSQAGSYHVVASNICGMDSDSITVTYLSAPVVNLGNDTLLCTGQTMILDTTQSSNLQNMLWQDNSTGPSFTVSQAGIFWLQSTSQCGASIDSIAVSYVSAPMVNLGPDTVLCPNQALALNLSVPMATYLWQDNSTGSSFNVSQSGLYHVTATNPCGVATDSITVNYLPVPNPNLGNDTLLCQGHSIGLDASTPGATYQWQNNSSTPTLSVTQPGLYYVTVTNHCGSVSDSILIDGLAAPIVDLGPDATLCPGDILNLDATNPSALYQWQDQSTGATMTVTQTGLYSVQVSNACGTVTDNVQVDYLSLPFANLGGDTMLCLDTEYVIDLTQDGATYQWHDGQTTPTFTITSAGYYAVQVDNLCGQATDSLNVETEDCNCVVYVPNAFTPNADQLNDTFRPESNCVFTTYTFQIFDRWGELIYESTSPEQGWNGESKGHEAQDGVYVYRLEYAFRGEISEWYVGHVTLLR